MELSDFLRQAAEAAEVQENRIARIETEAHDKAEHNKEIINQIISLLTQLK